jgi:FlaA1/EpsC-like NDP-sugar epimerase
MKMTNVRVTSLVLALPRLTKRVVALTVDLSMCILAVWFSYYLRLGDFISLTAESEWSQGALWATVVSIALALPIFVVSDLYRIIFRHSGWPALLAVGRAVGVYGVLYIAIFTAIGFAGVPRTVGIIQPIILLLLIGASRAVARLWLSDSRLRAQDLASRSRVLIYGAGSAGRQLAAAMGNSQEMKVLGFMDDDIRLQGNFLDGKVIYAPSELAGLVSRCEVSDVLLAMPRLTRERRNEILSEIRTARVAVRTLPSLTEIAKGIVKLSDLRELDIDDLLGRESVAPIHDLLDKNVLGKVVLVTGAGGSIGGELCRQILSLKPAKLLMVEQSEFALYAIHQELEQYLEKHDTACPSHLIPLLASVQDATRMQEIMLAWRPHTVYHAAAYKHVPLVEHNLTAGIKNNVLGTLCAAQAAMETRVSDFVLISTDKAVRPTNVMGASKRMAEMVLQALAATQTDTTFSMVRFGNVLGSSGSVVPKFRQQIRDGGPITVTHPDVTRYFMTISEAAQLVIQAGAMAKGGDVFLLDMGQPVRIMDLARLMIELSGFTVRDELNPEGDIAIEVSGLRPGEKLYEELLIGDASSSTLHPRIMKAHEEFIPWSTIYNILQALEDALNKNDIDTLRVIMRQLVTGYTPMENTVDWLYMERESLDSISPTR